ncbi:LysR family transcriptional regulator [Pasteurellaceae bacterium RH1A]|nr:LysR family transcriptional regulator [Pasteurellaceae bacterium RH1A]
MDKLNAISLFCKVIETQSFTQAAAQEQISLAMASKLVAQLEAHLNVRLLNRTTRKITPTEAGLLYYQRCLPILTELKEAEDSVTNITSTLQGKITMSVPMDFGSRFVAPFLGRFLETYPNVQLHVDFNDRKVDVVSEGYDLVMRVGQLTDSSIVAKRIAQSHHLLLASPDYLAQHGMPQTVADLDGHNFLLYESYMQWILFEGGQQIRYKPKGSFYCNSGYALVQMAKSGLGIINTPKFLVKEELASGQLINILPHINQHTLDISLLYPHRRYLSPKVRVMIDFLQGLMEEQRVFL